MSRTHATLIAADVDAHPHPTGHAEVVDAIAAGDPAAALDAVDHYLNRSIEALA
jgi:DNA-binding FadR family transcriptional regulator